MVAFGLLLLAPFVHLWRKARAAAGTAQSTTATPAAVACPPVAPSAPAAPKKKGLELTRIQAAAGCGAVLVAWLTDLLAWYFALVWLAILGHQLLRKRPGEEPACAIAPTAAAHSEQPSAHGTTLPCSFAFSYRAQDGSYSRRTANVTGISSSGGHTYLEGFCHDRMDSRTFRTDRILGDLTDTETGELVPVARLLSGVRTRTSMDYRPTAPAPASRAAKEWQTAVFFAGFRGGKLDELEGLADAAGWQIRSTISHTVDYVVRNGSAGKKQLAEAENLGIPVIDEDTFRTLL